MNDPSFRELLDDLEATLGDILPERSPQQERVHGVGFGKKKHKPPTGQPRGGFAASLQRKPHMKHYARRRPG